MPFDKQGRWFPDAGGSNYKNYKIQQEQKKKQEEQSQEQDRRRKSAELALAGLEGIKKIISILPRATTTSKPQEPSKPATTPYKPPQQMVQRSWNQQPLEDAGWIGTPKPGTTPVSTQVNGTPQDLKNILGRSALDNMLSKQPVTTEKPIQVPDLYKAMAGTVDQQRDRQQKIGPGKTDAVIPGAAGGGAYSDHLAQSQQAIKDALDKGDSGALSMALFKHEQLRSQIGEQYNKVPTIGPRNLSPWQKTVENTQEFGKNAETFGANAVQGFAESIPGVNALSKAITGHDTNKMAQEYAQYLADLKADPALGSPMSPEDYFKFEGKMVGAAEASDILRRAGVDQGGWAGAGHFTGNVIGTAASLAGGGSGAVAKGVTTLSKHVLKSSPKWLQSQVSGILGAAAAGMTYQTQMELGQELAHPDERSLKEHVQNIGRTGLYYAAYGVAAPWAEKFMRSAGSKLPGPVNNALKTLEQKSPRLTHVAKSATEGLLSGGIVGTGMYGVELVKTGDPQKALDQLTGEAKSEMAENFVESIAYSLMRRGGAHPAGIPQAPGISEGHDHIESIANRVVNKLNDTDKDDYNEAMKDAEAQGISRTDAHSVLLDELAKTEEGQQQITEAVEEEFDSHVENKVANAAGQPETEAQAPESAAPTEQQAADGTILWVGGKREVYQNPDDLHNRLSGLDETQLRTIADEYKITGAGKVNAANLPTFITDALTRNDYSIPRKAAKDNFDNSLNKIKKTVSEPQFNRIQSQLNKFVNAHVDYRVDKVLFDPITDSQGMVAVNFTDLKTDQEHTVTIDPQGQIISNSPGREMKRDFKNTLAEWSWDHNRSVVPESEADWHGWTLKDRTKAKAAEKLRNQLEQAKNANNKPQMNGNATDEDFHVTTPAQTPAETKAPEVKPQPVSDPQPGMQVGIAGKGDARFTVVSTDAKGFVKLRSEQGTELPAVHKGNLFTMPQQAEEKAQVSAVDVPAEPAQVSSDTSAAPQVEETQQQPQPTPEPAQVSAARQKQPEPTPKEETAQAPAEQAPASDETPPAAKDEAGTTPEQSADMADVSEQSTPTGPSYSYYYGTATLNGQTVSVTLNNEPLLTFNLDEAPAYPRDDNDLPAWNTFRTALNKLVTDKGFDTNRTDGYKNFTNSVVGSIEKLLKEHKMEQEPENKPAPEQAAPTSDETPPVAKDEGGTTNEPTDRVGTDGERPLGGTPSEDVPSAESIGETGGSAVRGPREQQGRGDGSVGTGDGSADSMGSDSGNVDSSTGRGNNADAGDRSDGMGTKRSSVTERSTNYVITEDADLGFKGAITSARKNIEAVGLMKQIVAEGRPATDEEKQTLAQYIGWGGIKQLFEPEWKVQDGFKPLRAELKQLLTDEEWRAADDSADNAHYTSIPVIRAMYDGIKALGFDGGKILEPSMGAGHFLGAMPRELSKATRATGVELDYITGNIAKLLYPQSDVRVMGFQDAKMADDFYDVAIGNVPFGNIGIADAHYKGTPVYKASIHNYFFAKALDKVRPGGVVAFITSRYTLDSTDSKFRRYLSSQADLVGAIRLPNTAFKGNANTEVVTDIVILQKRPENTAPADASWVDTNEMKLEGTMNRYQVNNYFHDHPENVLGELRVSTSGMYGRNELTVTPTHEDLGQAIREAFATLPQNIIPKREKKGTEDAEPRELIAAPGHIKENAYYVSDDGKLYVKRNDNLEPADVPKATAERIKGMVGVRNAAREYLGLQLQDNAAEKQLQASRDRLNKVYDAFVKKWDYLNKQVNARAYVDDPDAYLLLSLENWDKDTQTATKADIFSKRTISRYKPAEKAGTSKEALVIVLNEKGHVDLAHMARLTGKPVPDVINDLDGLIYDDPQKGWVTTDEYLSGNVRAKLVVAENAAALDPSYQKNVDALTEVQPTDIIKEEIDVNLGSPWIPTEHIQGFLANLSGYPAQHFKVGYNNAIATWAVTVPEKKMRERIRSSTEVSVKWATTKYDALDFVEMALNNKDPKVTYTVKTADGTKTRTDKKATLAAKEKMKQVKAEFTRWLWEDDERSADLAKLYNEKFNTERLREFDGDHLTFPGMSPVWQNGEKTLKKHQKAAIWRTVQNGNTLLAHAVGAGKTAEMIASMMEMKRLGIVNKPVWVVPNHLVAQSGAAFMDMYPAANILVAGKKDFEAKRRKKLFAKIATGNFDAVIVAHSSFGHVPMSEESIQTFYEEQIRQITDAIEQEAIEGTRKKSRLGSKLRSARKKLITKMNTEMQKVAKDDNVTFEELGIDGIVLDEAHEFKNLFYSTKLENVAGLGTADGSGMAFDMYMKVRYLQRLNGGRGIVFATGTPVSNSLVEMYTFQRYLQSDELERRGIASFDSWVQQFGAVKSVMELKPEGKGLRQRTRLAEIFNLPELLQLFRGFADVKTADELLSKGLIARPDLVGGKRGTVEIQPSMELLSFVEELARRAEAIRDGKVTQEEDNMLAVVDAGRKAALDMRLIDPNLADDPNSKVNVAASKVAETYKNTKKFKTKSGKTIENGTQLVFLDLSTPKAEKTNKNGDTVEDDGPIDEVMASVYQDLRKKLIKNGVDPKDIAFIHDYSKDEQKEELYRKFNNGEIRILMGSTRKMGAGMNVQKRLTDLWHVDVPYRPMDVEQREGRILRQGNMNDEVRIHAMITKRSFDAYMWQLIAAKAKIVDQVMTGNLKARRVSDPSGMEMSANEIKAQATDDDRMIKLAELQQEVAVLDNLRQSAIDLLRYLRADYARRAPRFKDAQAHNKKWEADLAQRQDTTGDKFTVKIGNETFTDRAQAAEKLFAIGKDLFAKKEMQKAEKIGEFAGFPLLVEMAQNKDTNQYYVTFILEGQIDHTFGLTDTATGLLSSMERYAASFDRRIQQQQDAIADESKQLGKFASEEKRLVEENNRLNLEFNKMTEEKQQLEQELGVDPTSDDDEIQDGETDGSDDDYGDDTLDYSAPDDGDNEDSTLGLAAPIKKSKIQAAASVIQHTDKVLTPNTALQLAEMLTKHLETIMDKGHISRRKALGQFNYQSNEGRVRSEHFGNWRVIGHEIGHAFDKHKGYIGDELELRAMWQALYPNPAKSTPVSTQIKEGFAEFFQQWVVDPDLARQNAPLTTDMFENKVLTDRKLAPLFAKIRTIVDADLGDNALGRAVAGSTVPDFTDDGSVMGDSYLVEDNDEGLANYAVGRLRRAIFEYLDSLMPAKHMAKAAKAQGYENPEYLVKLLSIAGDAQAKALAAFQAPMRDAEGRFLSGASLEDQYQEIVNQIGEAIGWEVVKLKSVNREIKILNKSIYKQYKKMGALEIAGAILVARRVQERRGKGFTNLPMTEDMANEIMTIANQRFPEAVKAAEVFTSNFSDVILEKLERADILTPETRQRIEDGSDFYIPFFYDEKKATFVSGTSKGGQTYSQVAKKFKGKFMPVLDPLQAAILKLTQLEQAVEQKRIITEIMNLAKHEGMGPFASIIPISKLATKVDMGEAMASIAKLVGITDQTQFGQDFLSISDALQGFEMKLWSQDAYKTLNGEPVLLNWVGGQPVAIKVAPDILKMLQSLQPVQLNAFFKGLAWTSRKFRATALLTPTYMKNALSRDVVTAIIQSKNNIGAMAKHSGTSIGVMMGAYLNHRGLETEWSDYQEAQYQLFVSSGGASSATENMLRGMTGKLYDRNMIATKAPGWFKARGKNGKQAVVRVLHTPSDMLRFIEEGPRITEFMSTIKKEFKRVSDERVKAGLQPLKETPDQLYERLVREGTDALPQELQDKLERILVEATYNSAEVTTNFRLHGANKVFRAYLPTVSFLHGTIQGTMRMARQVREKKVPTFAYSTLMVGGLSALSWALMMADDDDRKWFQELPSNMRDRYWWFPMGAGLYYTIAKPFDYALFANWGERFLDWQSENPNLPPFLQHEREPNSRSWTTDLGSLASTITGTDKFSNTIKTVAQMWANRNDFGSDIVPFGESSDLFPWRQYDSSTSLTGRKIAEVYAKLAGDAKGFSPRMVDYFVENMFGKFGTFGLNFSDWLGSSASSGKIERFSKAQKSGPEYNFYYGALVYGPAEGGSARTVEKFYDDYHNTIKLMGTVTDLLQTDDTKQAAKYATDENIKMLALYPGMKSIADYLSNVNKEIDIVIGDKATTAEQRHQKTLQRNYIRRLAAGIIYGQTPPSPPEASGMTEADVEAIMADIMWDVDGKTVREFKKAGGASDLADQLAQLKGTR